MADSIIQSNFSSILHPDRIASYDQEISDQKTMQIIHSAARLLYVREGLGTMMINDAMYTLKPGMLIAILPWDVTDLTEVLEPLTYDRIIYNFQWVNFYLRTDFNPEQRFLELMKVMRDHPVYCTDQKSRSRVENVIQRLREEVGIESVFSDDEKQEETRPYSQLYTITLIIEMMILFGRGVGAPVEPEERLAEDATFRVSDLLNFLYSHMQEKITLERLNRMFYVSQSTITKRLKETLGYTFQELIATMRINKAKNLLLYTDLTLNEIARLIGLNDGAHLIHSFENIEGMTPKEFRTTYRKEHPRDAYLKTSETAAAMTIINEIFAHYQEPTFTAQEVARKFQLSIAELNRMTMYHVERPANEFIAWLRVNRASELLLQSDLPVTEVAFVVGFNTLKTFYRYFRKYFSTSPTHFRERVRYQNEDGSIRAHRSAEDEL